MALDSTRIVNSYGISLQAKYPEITAGQLVIMKANLKMLMDSILNEFTTNGVINTTVPATGILDSLGAPCSGAASGTGGIS